MGTVRSGAAGVAQTQFLKAGGRAREPGFLRVGQAADGVGGKLAAHERAGERGHAGAGLGRSRQARPSGSGGFDGDADSGGSFGSEQLPGWGVDRGGRGLRRRHHGLGHGHYGRRGRRGRAAGCRRDTPRELQRGMRVRDHWRPGCNWTRHCWEELRQAARSCRRWWRSWIATETAFCRNGRRCLPWKKPAAAGCTSTIRGCRQRLRRRRRWRNWRVESARACCTPSSKPWLPRMPTTGRAWCATAAMFRLRQRRRTDRRGVDADGVAVKRLRQFQSRRFQGRSLASFFIGCEFIGCECSK